jgi:hypothetical protein
MQGGDKRFVSLTRTAGVRFRIVTFARRDAAIKLLAARKIGTAHCGRGGDNRISVLDGDSHFAPRTHASMIFQSGSSFDSN